MRSREQNAAPNKYTDIQAEYAEHSSLPCTLDGMRTVGLIQSDSMDLQNDPRFFQSNVLNKRLAAFSKVELGVISSLMLSACTHVIEMKKDLNFQTTEGILRALSFGLLSIVMFLSIITTYVGVAQMYHTCRLETAGPTGFEIATSYYLNPNIVAWRHFAVRCMIHGLTIFLISTGIRVSVTFEDVAEEAGPRISKTSAHILGLVTLMLFCIAGTDTAEETVSCPSSMKSQTLTRNIGFARARAPCLPCVAGGSTGGLGTATRSVALALGGSSPLGSMKVGKLLQRGKNCAARTRLARQLPPPTLPSSKLRQEALASPENTLCQGKPPAEPPIHCGGAADEKKELVETMQLRSAGERSTGREKDGPATKKLKDVMAEQEGQVKPKPVQKHDFKGMKKETLITTPFRIERLWTEKTADENIPKEPPGLTPGRPLGRGPKFPGREELINEGPFPLRSRIAQLATHVYYLWGETKFTDYLARGTPAQNVALNLEHFARQAHHAAGKLLEDTHVPLSRPPPNLPVEVSEAPVELLLLRDRFSPEAERASFRKPSESLGLGFL
ncbi:unnamed protein product [Effrenium voratum]|nr:unnamed protein product [Effrenium voratum]